LDALIICVGVLTLLPTVSDLLRSSPALRLIRFTRLALYGTRAGGSATVDTKLGPSVQLAAPLSFKGFALESAPTEQFQTASWEQILERITSKTEDWLMVSGLNTNETNRIAEALQVPVTALRSSFFDSPFPRIERMENYVTLFMWYPQMPDYKRGDLPTITRNPVLLVASMDNVVTLTLQDTDLPSSIPQRMKDMDPSMPLLMRTTAAFLKVIVRRYARIGDALEMAVLGIEARQGQVNDKQFLDETFRLRSEISRVRSSVKHLVQVLRQLADRPVAIRGFDQGSRASFTVLGDDADSIYDSVDDLMDNLSALVDLRLNISSFQMNKVMRLLAILTGLTLLPAVTGGLLGMNLIGNPWPPSLLQVVYCLGFGMSSCLYIFAVKGWFR
jgi:Mg2+ and Co2+ transporter CorA